MEVASMYRSEFLIAGGLAFGLDLFFILGIVTLINYRKQLSKAALNNLMYWRKRENNLRLKRK